MNEYSTSNIKKDLKISHFIDFGSDSAGQAVRWGLTLVINAPQGSSAGHKLRHCLQYPFIVLPIENPGWLHNCFGDQY